MKKHASIDGISEAITLNIQSLVAVCFRINKLANGINMFNISKSDYPEVIPFVNRTELNLYMLAIAAGFFGWGTVIFRAWG